MNVISDYRILITEIFTRVVAQALDIAFDCNFATFARYMVNNHMQQQERSDREGGRQETPLDDHSNAEYTTHINELISQPATDNIYQVAAQYIYKSLFELSDYLFRKKLAQDGQVGRQGVPGQAFNSYLLQMGQELGRRGKLKASKAVAEAREAVNIESQLVKCYQRVESIYFEEKYCLDLSYFQLFYAELRSSSRDERSKVNRQLEHLVEELDLVEINLFSQIHCKFQEYFAVAANFQYLQESVGLQLRKLAESRRRIQRVKREIVDKSVVLRQRIVQRQNIERTLKTIKVMKSIKKLPQVMESILASSLPYDCLELLQQTKTSLDSVRNLKCLSNTADSIRSMEALAQNDLSKRYSNDLYLYLEECHLVNLQEIWGRLEVRSCLDKDNSLIIDELNSSTASAQSQVDMILDNLDLQGNQRGTKFMTPRLEEREYQIAMILLQSYQYISFTPEVIKIKVCGALRKFCKTFEKELLSYLNKVVRMEIDARKDNQKVLEEDKEKQAISPPLIVNKRESEEQEVSPDVVEKVTVEFYSKHLGVLNDIFRETILRFLGYLHTLVTEYQEELLAQSQRSDGSPGEQERMTQRHRKFKNIFLEECSMLPSIFKIIEQKLKYLLTLKNIRNINAFQYFQWISVLKYWQRFFDYLAEEHPLINFTPNENQITRPLIAELSDIVAQNLRKAIHAMNLKSLLLDLTVDYISVFHNNTLERQIINTLQEDTWQSTEVPQEFSDILNNILNPQGTVLNASITVLDSSTSSKGAPSRECSRDLSRELRSEQGRARIKFKLLKNNILVGGVRYKVNLSLIILCETIGEYVKMNRILSGVLPSEWVRETGFNRISRCVYEKIFDLIHKFCLKSRELILQTKALAFGRIKGKNINAKHICLLCNCYSILIKLTEEILQRSKLETYQLVAAQTATIVLLETTHGQLTSKLALILNTKIGKDIEDCISQEKTNPSIGAKTNNSIITAFLQMVEITDDYLEIEDIKRVLRSAFQTLSQKYFTHLLLKGEKYRGEVQLLAQKLKFLKKYFLVEYQALLREIPSE